MAESNPFEAPTTEYITAESALDMDDEDALLNSLRFGSTWKLVGLAIITMGIYDAHYMHFQTRKLNTFLDEDNRISLMLTSVILALSYLTTVFILMFIFSDTFEFIQQITTINEVDKGSDLFDKIAGLMGIIWAFKVRNRMNTLHRFRKHTSKHWFHGFWTFLFQNWYFNWKVNQILADREHNAARSRRVH